jgi:hypothetical protein
MVNLQITDHGKMLKQNRIVESTPDDTNWPGICPVGAPSQSREPDERAGSLRVMPVCKRGLERMQVERSKLNVPEAPFRDVAGKALPLGTYVRGSCVGGEAYELESWQKVALTEAVGHGSWRRQPHSSAKHGCPQKTQAIRFDRAFQGLNRNARSCPSPCKQGPLTRVQFAWPFKARAV